MSAGQVHGIKPALAGNATPVDELHPHPLNARTRDARARRVIRESLLEHGQYRSVFARRLEDGTVQLLGGHGTVEQARELGWTHVAVEIHDDVDDAAAARMVAVDNRSGDLASYDQARLVDLLEAAKAGGGDLDRIGYAADDMAELLATLGRADKRRALTDPDAAPAPPETPQTRVGDLILLGPHRLVVGDGTDPEVVALACDGQLADAYISDPPYNVDYTGKTADALTIDNDAMSPGEFETFLLGLFTAAAANTRPGGPAYVYHADSEGERFRRTFDQAGWSMRQVLVWIKDAMVLGRQDHHWQHEPILYGWKPGAGHTWLGGRTLTTLLQDDGLDPENLDEQELRQIVRDLLEDSTVLRHPRPKRSRIHPTMKPTAMLEKLLLRSTRPGARVLDTTAGSGSLVIACHAQDRTASVVELDPHYADVIARRYQEHTGTVPTRDGQPLSFVDEPAGETA